MKKQMFAIRVSRHDSSQIRSDKYAHVTVGCILGTQQNAADNAARELKCGRHSYAEDYAAKARHLNERFGVCDYFDRGCYAPDLDVTWQATLAGSSYKPGEPVYWYGMHFKVDVDVDSITALRWLMARIDRARTNAAEAGGSGKEPLDVIKALLALPSCFGLVEYCEGASAFGPLPDDDALVAAEAVCDLPKVEAEDEASEEATQETASASA